MIRDVQVVAGLVARAGQTLVQRRPAEKALGGLWEFPGGKVEAGEAPAAALAREWLEELACEVDVLGAAVWSTTHLYGDTRVYLELYRCRLRRGEPTGREGQELRWAAPAGLRGLSFVPADVPLVKLLSEGALGLEAPGGA